MEAHRSAVQLYPITQSSFPFWKGKCNIFKYKKNIKNLFRLFHFGPLWSIKFGKRYADFQVKAGSAGPECRSGSGRMMPIQSDRDPDRQHWLHWLYLPHGADEKVRADVPGLEEGDEELAELFVPLLLLGPVVLALVLTRLLLVARHHNNLRATTQQAWLHVRH